jgi:hypothetical protein
MITDELSEAVCEAAEAIVRAEWMRLQHDDAAREHPSHAISSEMPAARTRPRTVDTLTTTERPRPVKHRLRAGWSCRCGPRRRVWPTQRSPPDHPLGSPNTVKQRR